MADGQEGFNLKEEKKEEALNGAAGRVSQEASTPEETEVQGNRKGAWWRLALLLCLLLAVAVGVRFLGVSEKLWALHQWLITLGPWGVLVFILIYITAVVAFMPGDLITMAAGAFFGSVLGIVVSSIGATAGASLAFLISRYCGRDAVVRWLGGNKKFQKLDRLTAEHGAIIVALTRLIPVFPFNLLNYGFGLTRVPFGTYLFWTWLCIIPTIVLYVVGADALAQGLRQRQVPWPLISVFVVALLFLVIVVRYARRTLQRKEIIAGPAPPSGGPRRRRRRTGKCGRSRRPGDGSGLGGVSSPGRRRPRLRLRANPGHQPLLPGCGRPPGCRPLRPEGPGGRRRFRRGHGAPALPAHRSQPPGRGPS